MRPAQSRRKGRRRARVWSLKAPAFFLKQGSKIFNKDKNKGLFDEKSGMEWNQDLNHGGLGTELES